eukprot:1179095-Prorocentrum_minimum.AAC.7
MASQKLSRVVECPCGALPREFLLQDGALGLGLEPRILVPVPHRQRLRAPHAVDVHLRPRSTAAIAREKIGEESNSSADRDALHAGGGGAPSVPAAPHISPHFLHFNAHFDVPGGLETRQLVLEANPPEATEDFGEEGSDSGGFGGRGKTNKHALCASNDHDRLAVKARCILSCRWEGSLGC